MRRSLSSLLMALLLVGLAASAPGGGGVAIAPPGNGGAGGSGRQDRSENGDYLCVVRGFYRGNGMATVTSTSVLIDADVVTDDGRSGKFSAELTTVGPYFSGEGTLIGQAVSVRGRLDAPKASRLVATFKAADGHGGRIAAILPTDIGDEGWDDEQGNN